MCDWTRFTPKHLSSPIVSRVCRDSLLSSSVVPQDPLRLLNSPFILTHTSLIPPLKCKVTCSNLLTASYYTVFLRLFLLLKLLMGFFQTCSEALLHLLSFTPYSEPYSSQQPLALDDVTVYPEKASPGFTCHYPALPGWKSCNGPNSRDCWLNDTNSPQPLFTQYK